MAGMMVTVGWGWPQAGTRFQLPRRPTEAKGEGRLTKCGHNGSHNSAEMGAKGGGARKKRLARRNHPASGSSAKGTGGNVAKVLPGVRAFARGCVFSQARPLPHNKEGKGGKEAGGLKNAKADNGALGVQENWIFKTDLPPPPILACLHPSAQVCWGLVSLLLAQTSDGPRCHISGRGPLSI